MTASSGNANARGRRGAVVVIDAIRSRKREAPYAVVERLIGDHLDVAVGRSKRCVT
jgi:hypothetical protein